MSVSRNLVLPQKWEGQDIQDRHEERSAKSLTPYFISVHSLRWWAVPERKSTTTTTTQNQMTLLAPMNDGDAALYGPENEWYHATVDAVPSPDSYQSSKAIMPAISRCLIRTVMKWNFTSSQENMWCSISLLSGEAVCSSCPGWAGKQCHRHLSG